MKAVDRILGEAMTPYQKGIYKNPQKALDWSLKNHRRFLEAEPYIAKDPYLAYMYASSVIGGRWPEAERESLVNDPRWSAHYAKHVIKGRWPEAEPAIAKDPDWSCWYARTVINKKVWLWDRDENSDTQRWPEAEPAIVEDPFSAYHYAKDVIKGRWPEAEPAIAKSPSAYDYAMDVIKGRWPEAEETIAKSEYKDHYLKEWPEAKDDWAMNGWIDWLDT